MLRKHHQYRIAVKINVCTSKQEGLLAELGHAGVFSLARCTTRG